MLFVDISFGVKETTLWPGCGQCWSVQDEREHFLLIPELTNVGEHLGLK